MDGQEVNEKNDIAKAFVRDEVDVDILEELLSLGKLFDYVAMDFPDSDTEDFILAYMKSNTRRFIDEAQAYVCTMSAKDLWAYFCRTDRYVLKEGTALKGFLPDWMGSFTRIINGSTVFRAVKSSKRFRSII